MEAWLDLLIKISTHAFFAQVYINVFLSQDADVLKVGVADLINQWVKGSDEGSRSSSPSKPAVSQTFPPCIKIKGFFCSAVFMLKLLLQVF